MSILKQIQDAVLTALRTCLHTYAYESATQTEIENLAKTIHDEALKCKNAMAVRNYLTSTLNSASIIWRKLAPYTAHNRLLIYIESVVESPEFSTKNILQAQNTELHEHYMQQQNTLFRPLQVEIANLKIANKILTKSVNELQQENKRLRVENDFLMQEMQQMFCNISGKLSNIEQQTRKGEVDSKYEATVTMVH